jgi:hypothetical protein
MSEWLHICPECGSELVQALDAVEAGPHAWNVRMRCPECWLEWGARFSDDQVEAFEEHFALGLGVLSEALEGLTRENMEDDIERFTAALAVDAIVPMDF